MACVRSLSFGVKCTEQSQSDLNLQNFFSKGHQSNTVLQVMDFLVTVTNLVLPSQLTVVSFVFYRTTSLYRVRKRRQSHTSLFRSSTFIAFPFETRCFHLIFLCCLQPFVLSQNQNLADDTRPCVCCFEALSYIHVSLVPSLINLLSPSVRMTEVFITVVFVYRDIHLLGRKSYRLCQCPRLYFLLVGKTTETQPLLQYLRRVCAVCLNGSLSGWLCLFFCFRCRLVCGDGEVFIARNPSSEVVDMQCTSTRYYIGGTQHAMYVPSSCASHVAASSGSIHIPRQQQWWWWRMDSAPHKHTPQSQSSHTHYFTTTLLPHSTTRY